MRVCLLLMTLSAALLAGCAPSTGRHPAIGRGVGRVPLVSLRDPQRPAPTFIDRVTLLNFWGTWCPPCRRELPGLARLATSLADDDRFQLVAISCGSGGPDDLDEIGADTRRFLDREKLSIDAWADPRGLVRMAFAEGYGFTAFPTTYLIGPDGRVRRVWSGYRSRDEAEIAAAIVETLRECPPPAPAPPAGR